VRTTHAAFTYHKKKQEAKFQSKRYSRNIHVKVTLVLKEPPLNHMQEVLQKPERLKGSKIKTIPRNKHVQP
jgi:hypothetical protein